MTTPIPSIADAAGLSLIAIEFDGSRRLTAGQFKAIYAASVSRLGLTKGSEVPGLAAAIRDEERAIIGARTAAMINGLTAGVAGKPRTILTAEGSAYRLSVPYSRAGTDAETIAACKAVLAKPAPDANASEGAKAQYHARQRHATITLCRLDADFALADAERRLARAEAHHAKLEAAALLRQQQQQHQTA